MPCPGMRSNSGLTEGTHDALADDVALEVANECPRGPSPTRNTGNAHKRSVPADTQASPTLLKGLCSPGAASGDSSPKPPLRRERSRLTSHLTSTSFGTMGPPSKIAEIVKSSRFEGVLALVILGNCFTMGIEAEAFLHGRDSIVSDVAEHIFTTLFLVELILRLWVYGVYRFLPCCGGFWWDLMDAMLVLVTGVLPIWILPLLGIMGASTLRTLTVLRALRLVRLLRVLRVEWFHEVWLLLRGMIESMRMLFWTVVVIAFITYIFAVFGVVLISVDLREEYDRILAAPPGADEKLLEEDLAELTDITGGVMPFMFTLVQVLTLDSWTALVRRIMRYSHWSWVFFYMYVSLAVLVLMNIVTAVLVDHALLNSKKDADELLAQKEKEKQHALRQFRRLFESMDSDGSGTLSRKEFDEAFCDPDLAAKLRSLDVQPQDCEEIFSLLDSGDGVLSLQEFFDGLQRMEGHATAKDLFRVLKRTESLSRHLKEHIHEHQVSPFSPLHSSAAERGPGVILTGLKGIPASRTGSSLCAPEEQKLSDAVVLQRLDAVVAAVSACDAKVERCLRELNDIRRGAAAAV